MYSSQYLQIIFTLGIIPVPLVIHGLRNFISRSYKCRLTRDRVQITFIRTGERESIHLFIVYTAVCVHSWTNLFFIAITVLKTIPAMPRKVAVDSFSLENTLLSIVNVEIKVIQLFKSTAYSILVRHVELFSCLCIFAHWSLVTGVVECSRIYHVLSNLLGMLRNSFVALSSKQYFLDFFEDAHVPMPDISGYIRERVNICSLVT